MNQHRYDRYRRLCILFLLLFISQDGRAQIYEDFNLFCMKSFGALNESLTYQRFGNTLSYVDSGGWVHESETSAALSFETSLPARSYIEYGTTNSYGLRTADTDRYYYIHLHYLKDLQPNSLYHYRLVATDERGTRVLSSDRTVQTRNIPNVIHIPGSMGAPPYILNQTNKTYVVTQNLVAATRAFTIKASGITLDLDGHDIVYDDQPALISNTTWEKYAYSEISTFGIYCYNVSGNIKIVNGKVRQGSNNGAGDIGLGFNPVFVEQNAMPIEIAGLTLEYSGVAVDGLIARYGDILVHHNVITDRGIGILNRSQGVRALWTFDNGAEVHHNLVRRTRHQGIVASGNVFSNEIYVDSYATNGFAIDPWAAIQIYDNKIFGSGYHVVGIGWESKIKVYGNFINLLAVAPTTRSVEYEADSSVIGIRLTQYDGDTKLFVDNLYQGNTIIVKGREGALNVRGVQISSDPYVRNLVFSDNTVKAETLDLQTERASCVVAQGIQDRASQLAPVFYRNNTFIANNNHLRFGDSYASGGNHRFEHCRFIKIGNDARFRTIVIGFWIWDTFGNRIIDPVLEGGADLQNPLLEGTGKCDFSVGHFLQIAAKDTSGALIPLAAVEVYDNTGMTAATTTDGGGSAALELLEYTFSNSGGQATLNKSFRSGHNIRIPGYAPVQISAQTFAVRNNQSNPVVLTFRRAGSPQDPKNLRFIKKME
jgi:hypothetical protein